MIALGSLGPCGWGTLDNAADGTAVTFQIGGNNQSSEFDGVIQDGSDEGALSDSDAVSHLGPAAMASASLSDQNRLDNVFDGITLPSRLAGSSPSPGFDGHRAYDDGNPTDGSGTVALTKVGTGTLTVTGASTYSGATAIQNGTLSLAGGDNLLPTGTVVTLGDGQGDSGVLQLASGTTETIDGLTTVGAGSGNCVMGDGGAGVATLTLQSDSDWEFDGTLGGGAADNNLALVKQGAGTLTLNGANTYTGGTTVSGGTFALFGNNKLSTTGGITITTGVLDLGGYTQSTSGPVSFQGGTVQHGTICKSGADYDAQGGTISAVLAGSVGLTKTGAGTLIFTNHNTYSGGTLVNGGTLVLDAPSDDPNGCGAALANSSSLTISNATVSVQSEWNGIWDWAYCGTLTINSGGVLSADGPGHNAHTTAAIYMNGNARITTTNPQWTGWDNFCLTGPITTTGDNNLISAPLCPQQAAPGYVQQFNVGAGTASATAYRIRHPSRLSQRTWQYCEDG